MDVIQCPRCELRFASRPEQLEHLVHDHGFSPSTVEPFHYASAPPAAPVGGRCLVVANQTLGGREVLEAVRKRIAAGTTRFLVLVPATSAADQGLPDGGASLGRAIAASRLQAALETLQQAGCEAEGRVGPSDPELAVAELLREEHVDEILLATLPPGISRWLGIDLPTRLRKRFRVPVSTVVTTAPIAVGF